MIEITVKQTIWTTKTLNKNVLTKKTPTEIVAETKDRYDSSMTRAVQFVEEYAVLPVDETSSREYVLLKQEIPLEKEGTFDLAAVIKAINGLA